MVADSPEASLLEANPAQLETNSTTTTTITAADVVVASGTATTASTTNSGSTAAAAAAAAAAATKQRIFQYASLSVCIRSTQLLLALRLLT